MSAALGPITINLSKNQSLTLTLVVDPTPEEILVGDLLVDSVKVIEEHPMAGQDPTARELGLFKWALSAISPKKVEGKNSGSERA